MADRNPRFVWITATHEQARQLLEGLAGDDPPGFADELGGSVRDLWESRTREVLQYFGIYVPQEAVPPQVVLPPEDDVRSVLRDLERGEAGVEPYVGFRPPWCTNVPPHAVTFQYIFEVVVERAADRPNTAS